MRMILTQSYNLNGFELLKPAFCRSENGVRKLVGALIPVQTLQPSYGGQDRPDLINPTAGVRPDSATALVMDVIAGKLQDLKPDDPLANLRSLEEACNRGWLLSTSQLAALLGVKSFSGKEFTRYGFRFTRVGWNGSKSAWRVEKSGLG